MKSRGFNRTGQSSPLAAARAETILKSVTNTNVFETFLNSVQERAPWLVRERVLLIVALALIAHVLVRVVHTVSDWLIKRSAAKKMPARLITHQPKFVTLTGLIGSGVTFVIYFFAVGLIAHELTGLNLAAYFATASVLGLAVGFGSQGLVQDVVTGVTLIITNTFDVGDMIEVSGQIGRVEKVGLRFTKLVNFYNQEVFVPNRTIANLNRFPAGGIFAYADVQLPPKTERSGITEKVKCIAKGLWGEFGAIILGEPEISEVEAVHATGWSYLRVQFKIWPGQGALIETTFKARVVDAMKQFDPNYAEWMVTVTYRATRHGPDAAA